MSIRDCLLKLDGDFDQNDLARLEELSSQYYDQNTSIDASDRKAVQVGLRELFSERQSYVKLIEDQGGTSPRRADERDPFKGTEPDPIIVEEAVAEPVAEKETTTPPTPPTPPISTEAPQVEESAEVLTQEPVEELQADEPAIDIDEPITPVETAQDVSQIEQPEPALESTEKPKFKLQDEKTEPSGMTADRVKTAVAPALLKTADKNLDNIQVVQSVSDLNVGLPEGANPKGVYHGGKVFLVADNIKNDRDARTVLAHEIIGHKGVIEGSSSEEWSGIKGSVNSIVTAKNPVAVDIMTEVERRYDGADEEVQVKEFLAIAAERRVKDGPVGRVVRKFKEMARRSLRAMGFKAPFSESDLDIILSNSEKYLEGEQDVAPNVVELKPEAKLTSPEITEHLRQRIANDYDTVVEEYNSHPESMGGKLLSSDIAKELSPHYLKDRTQAGVVHKESSQFVKQRYAELLAEEPKEGAEPLVIFTAGGGGAGKTSAISDIPSVRENVDNAQIVYDTTLSHYDTAKSNIEQALDAGKDVQIVYVHREAQDAIINGAIRRAMEQEAEFGTGRTIPIDVLVEAHVEAISTVKRLAKEYDNDPGVEFIPVNNSLGHHNAAPMDLENIPDITYTDIESKVKEALNAEYQAGRISDNVYRGFQAEAPGSTSRGASADQEAGQGTRSGGDKQPELRSDEGQDPLLSVDEEPADSSNILLSQDNPDYTEAERAVIKKGGFGKQPVTQKFKEHYNRTKQNLKTKIRQGMVDQYASFKDILNDDRTWMMAHLTSSAPGVVEMLVDAGKPFIKENAIGIETESKSLKDILKPLGKDIDRWTYWIAGNRANRLKVEGKENLFDQEDIDTLMGMNKGREELFESVRKDFDEMNDAVAQIGVETGLINAEEAAVWKEEGFYLPFYRVLDEETNPRGPRSIGDSGLVRQQAYKVLKGSTSQLDDLLGNALLNWNHLISASLKNQSAVSALDAAQKMGIAKRVPKAAKSKDAVFVKVDGLEQWYEIDDSDGGALVVDALLSLNWDGLNNRPMKAARAFKRALTIGVTASPEFKVANLMRDTIQAIAVADMSTNITKNLYQGWQATSKDNDAITQMIAGGGAFGDSGYIHGSDPEAIKRLADKGVERDTILDSRKYIKKVWDKYQDFGARLENINRAANYVQAIESGKDRLTANFEARDHLDFTRTGSFTTVRAIAQMTPFLNARLQGLDKLGRSAMSRKQQKQFSLVVGVYSALSVALYLGMKDDDDFKAAEEWERDAYHLFKIPGSETMYRFPRPFEIGAIASMAERLTEQMVNDDVHGELFAERLAHTLGETFSFNPVPQILKPAMEVAMNRSWFTGRDIESVGMRLSNLSPVNRKRAWTSETAIVMSEAMDAISWGKVVLSPVQVEHLVRGYLGWLGATSLAAADALATRPATGAPQPASMRFTEYPLIKRFARSGPARNTKYTAIFYDRLNEIGRAYGDIRQAKKLGETDKAIELMEDNKEKLRLRKYYNRQRKKLSDISRQMSKIRLNKSKSLSPSEKRSRMDMLTMRKNKITKQTYELSKGLF